MKGVPISPRRVFGVALSAAEDAGRQTWVCRGHPGAEGVRVESVDPLSELPGGAVDRDAAWRALVAKVLDAPRSAWGLDFAFGLPRVAVDRILGEDAPAIDAEDSAPALGRWRALLASLAEALPTDAAWTDTGRRRTEESGPAAGLPLRDRRRDLQAQAGILAPLAGQPGVAVLPHQPLPALPSGTPPAMRARAPHIYLLEVWPEAFLRRLAHDQPDAPDGADLVDPEDREAVVRALVARALVRPMAQRLRRRLAEAGDGEALRALLCAVGAWRGYGETAHLRLTADAEIGLEGYLYP